MAFNLEAAKTGAAPMKVERRESGARQDRWMSELEKAFVAAVPGKQEQPVAPAAPRAAPALAASAFSPRSHAPAASAVMAHGGAGSAASAAAAAAPEPDATARSARSAPQQAAAQAPVESNADAERDAAPLSEQAAAVDGAAAVVAAPTAPPSIVQGAGMPAATSMPAPFLAAPGSVALAGTASPAAAPAVGSGAPLTFGAALGAPLAPVQQAPGAGVELPEAPARAAAAPQADTRPFEKRAMHVYVDADGVHAWIRDAGLQQGQLRSVLQSMWAEVAQTGRNLATLTVNGKAVDPRLALFGDDDELFPSPEEDASGAASHPYLFQPAIKGNPSP